MKSFMKLNHICLVAVGVSVFCMMTSCLDEHPKDQLDSSAIYTTANDLYVNAVAALYVNIGSNTESEGLQGTCRGIYDYNTLTTDEAIIPIRGGDWYDGGLWRNMFLHTWTARDTYLYDVWKYLYRVIVKCNESLSIIESHKSILTTAQYTAYLAEVRGVRALFYYYTMDMFGRIPLVTSVDTNSEGVTQSERSKVFQFVVDELQEVESVLPNEHSNIEGTYYGRITRPVVDFLLAKLALNAEVYTDDEWTDGVRPEGADIFFTIEGQQMNAWQTCVYYCDKLTAAGYELENDYASNFSVHNTNSKENVFTIPLDKNLYTAEFHYLFRSRHYNHGGAYGGASENGTCATLTTMKTYHYGTDSLDTRFPLNFYADTVWVDGAMVMLDNGEPLVYRPLAVEVNLTNSPYKQTAGARMAKYEVDRSAYSDGKQVDNDIVLFRYADALLMKAEAKVRNGEDGSNELNAVRRRVGMPARTASLDNILEERLLELVWEGWRRQDLIRFGRFTDAYDLRPQLSGEASGYTTVFPIPQKCLELNSKLVQNKGYTSNDRP